MSKVLNKRFDDEIFNHFSILDWQYYEAMIKKDEDEADAKMLDLADYIVSFSNPKAVEATRNARKGVKPINNVENGDGHHVSAHSEEEFLAMARKMFSAPV